MTREEIESQYTVEDGVITSPGKFEGEPVYAPYYWALVLDGGPDEEYLDVAERPVAAFYLDASDVVAWPELAGKKKLELIENGDGFVICKVG